MVHKVGMQKLYCKDHTALDLTDLEFKDLHLIHFIEIQKTIILLSFVGVGKELGLPSD